jgi:hypothetical protein
MAGREALGAQEGDMFASELEQVGFLARLGFVRDDHDGLP